MKILVLGKGFLGKEFEQRGYEVWGRDCFQIGDDFSKLQEYDTIINCIGKSNTRWCEEPKNFKELMEVNAFFPRDLSQWCEKNNKKLVHISTGCLYDISYKPCKEDDFLVAHCNYTLSKFVAERYLNPERDLIIRPRLLFSGLRVEGHNNLLQKLEKFNTFINEFNSITWNLTIIDSIEALLKHNQAGAFNVANEGVYTIQEIAEMIGKTGKAMSADELRKIGGLYLVNNVMDLSKLKQFYQPMQTKEAVKICWNRLQNYK